MHVGQKNVEISITFSNPYHRRLRKNYLLFLFFPGPSIEKLQNRDIPHTCGAPKIVICWCSDWPKIVFLLYSQLLTSFQ